MFYLQVPACSWSDGSPLSYKNLNNIPLPSKDFSTSYKEVSHLKTSVPLDIISAILFMNYYWTNASHFGTLSNSSTSEHYERDTLISTASFVNTSQLCTFVAGHLFVFGQWYLLECNVTVKSPYIVCEKEHNVTEELRKSRIIPGKVSCLHPYQYYMRGVCYQLLNTTWPALTKNNCQEPAVKQFPVMSEENVISKWTYLLTSEIGIWQKKSGITCLRNLCMNCANQVTYSWSKSRDCDINSGKRYWLCQSAPIHNSFRYPDELFECADGTYILRHYKCDKKKHCGDNSDEKFCPWSRGPSNNRDRDDIALMMFIEIENLEIPLYEWYNMLKFNILQYITHYPSIHRRLYNVQDLGACPIGWSRCSPDNDSACYPNEHACVYERNIYGDPLYCANTANIKDCPTSSLPHICPSMFKCNQSYCIPYQMVSDESLIVIDINS